MTTTPRSTESDDETAVQQAKETVRDVADQVRNVASEAAARLPEAAATTRDAIVDAQRRIDSGSDETLSAAYSGPSRVRYSGSVSPCPRQ